jgi:hypothetical protein
MDLQRLLDNRNSQDKDQENMALYANHNAKNQRGGFKKTSLVTLLTVAAALTTIQATGPAAMAASSNTGASSTTAYQKLPAYLQGYRQPQMLCPGGSLVGRVSDAIVDPSVATGDAPGDCTLSDMKAANPGTRFFAYIDIGAMRPVEEWNGVFKNSCADPTTPDGARFAVTTSNPKIAKNQWGHATFPAYRYLSVADLSPAYTDSCVEVAKTILSTPSEKGTTDAAPAKFDGIFLDDASVSPSHGQDMVDVGQWGPWANDDAYGRAMVSAVKQFDTKLETAMGKPIPTAVNLGVYPAWSNQVNIAKELAATKRVEFALREHTVTDGNGRPQTVQAMKESRLANRAITAAGMKVIEHDYSVSLRELPVTAYNQGMEINPNAQCLKKTSSNINAISAAANNRRTLDHRMTLGHLLQSRTSTTKDIGVTVSQAEANCQDNAWDDDTNWENVTARSVNSQDLQILNLQASILSGAYSVADPTVKDGVETTKLSNGRYVAVNTNNSARNVSLNGKTISVPGRSATIN